MGTHSRKYALTEPRKVARATLASAAAKASRDPADPVARQAVEAARRDYYATALEDYVRRVVDEAPPLTGEQRSRLVLLLNAGGGEVA